MLFAVEATRRWADDGITVNALMPGGIRTNLQRHVDETSSTACAPPPGRRRLQWKTAEQGAATSVLLATSPLLDGVGGRYFEDCNEAAPSADNAAAASRVRPRPGRRAPAVGGVARDAQAPISVSV